MELVKKKLDDLVYNHQSLANYVIDVQQTVEKMGENINKLEELLAYLEIKGVE